MNFLAACIHALIASLWTLRHAQIQSVYSIQIIADLKQRYSTAIINSLIKQTITQVSY